MACSLWKSIPPHPYPLPQGEKKWEEKPSPSKGEEIIKESFSHLSMRLETTSGERKALVGAFIDGRF